MGQESRTATVLELHPQDSDVLLDPTIASRLNFDVISSFLTDLELEDRADHLMSITHFWGDEEDPLVIREVVTLNSDVEPEGNMVIMHGLSQLAHEGPSAALQEEMAEKHPNRRVFAVESDNMGEFSDSLTPLSLGEFFAYSIDRMAERRLEFLETLTATGEPTTLVDTSMGTLITMMAIKKAADRGISLNIDDVVLSDSAIVTKHRKPRMIGFLVHMPAAVVMELYHGVKNDHIDHSQMLKTGIRAVSAMGIKDVLAMGRQAFDVFFGTHLSDEDMLTAFDNFGDTQFLVVSGHADTLRTPKTYKKWKESAAHGNVHIKSVPWVGHGRSVNYTQLALDLSYFLTKYDQTHYPQDDQFAVVA